MSLPADDPITPPLYDHVCDPAPSARPQGDVSAAAGARPPPPGAGHDRPQVRRNPAQVRARRCGARTTFDLLRTSTSAAAPAAAAALCSSSSCSSSCSLSSSLSSCHLGLLSLLTQSSSVDHLPPSPSCSPGGPSYYRYTTTHRGPAPPRPNGLRVVADDRRGQHLHVSGQQQPRARAVGPFADGGVCVCV